MESFHLALSKIIKKNNLKYLLVISLDD